MLLARAFVGIGEAAYGSVGVAVVLSIFPARLRATQDGDGSLLIALNLGNEPVSVRSDTIGLSGEILLSTAMDRQGEAIGETLELRGNEGVILGPTKVPVI